MEDLNKIQNHFSEQERIQHDINSYHYEALKPQQNYDPYEKPREDFLLSIFLNYHTGGKVLDVGCGIGNLVGRLLSLGVEANGIDLSPEMIKTAKKILMGAGHTPDCVECADIFKYTVNHTYEKIIANGVIWYYQNKQTFLAKLHELLNKNGMVIIVHRNDLFNLFAMNQGTLSFLTNKLYDNRTEKDKSYVKEKLLTLHPNLSSPIKVNSDLTKDYDNPLTISELYQSAGFEVISVQYTYIHPFPPMFIAQGPDVDYAALQEEYGRKWQGMFLGSQFIVTARKL